MATACFGFVGHTWQNTAMAGSEIGLKGMLKAAEVMALAAVKTAERPDLIEKARKELLEKNGGSYSCPLPDHMEPPIGRY
jgi:aminobenzoyl-glutamate utilization protein B